MTYKPVGVDESSNFPPRVQAALDDKFVSTGDLANVADPEDVAGFVTEAAATVKVEEQIDAQFPTALVAHSAVAGVSVNRIVAAPLGSSPTVENGDLVVYYDAPGANYYTNFSAHNIGTIPNGWTQLWGSTNWTVQAEASAEGGKALVVNPAATAALEYALTWDAINPDPERGTVEILFRYRAATGQALMAAFARGSGTGAGNGRGHRMGLTTVTDLRTAYYTAGSLSNPTAPSIPAIPAGTWHLIRARISGATQKVKIWADGTTEPGWMVESNLTAVPEAGAVGLMLSRYGNGGVHQIDWFAAATGGRAAVKQ